MSRQLFTDRFRSTVLTSWGKLDPIFSVEDAACHQKDLPPTRTHVLDGSHMVHKTNIDELLTLVGQRLRFFETSDFRRQFVYEEAIENSW